MTDVTFKKYCLVVDEWFINGFVGVKAYQKYYPKSNDDTAAVKFNRLVSLGKVKKYTKNKQAKMEETSDLKQIDIIKELESFAMLDTTEIITIGSKTHTSVGEDEDGKPKIETYETTGIIIKDFKELTDVQRRSIKTIKETRYGIEITFFSKETAFEMLNKHKGHYEKDNNQKKAPAFVVFDGRKKEEK